MTKKIALIIVCVIGLIGSIVLCVTNLKKLNKTISYDARVEELLKDDKEVERKWLIKKEDIPYDLSGEKVYVYDIQQTYLCFDPEMRVRNYDNGDSYEMTIKTNMSKDGMVRDETNMDISKEQYDNLITKKEGNTIHKTRYQFFDDGQVVAIDIFHEELDGLAYMEIEFPNRKESESFQEPSWVVKDVTDDIRYKNGHLARYGIPVDAYQ